MAAEHVAPGVEVHHKSTPEAERGLRFAVCYCDSPRGARTAWYAVRRAATAKGAETMVGTLRKAYGGAIRPRENFRVWDTTAGWPNAPTHP